MNGRYRRTIGKFINSEGKLAPKKFMLGTDPRRAEIANLKLEQLWSIVIEHHHEQQRSRPLFMPPTTHDEPLWGGVYLRVAEAVRLGQDAITVGPDHEDERSIPTPATRPSCTTSTRPSATSSGSSPPCPTRSRGAKKHTGRTQSTACGRRR